MKRLNRKEVAELIRDFGNYSGWAEKYWNQFNQGNNTEVEQSFYRSGYVYWCHMKDEIEVRLAEIGILIHDDLSEKYLAEWDWNEASTKFNRLYHDFREAKKAYEAEQEQQEQEESTGAVA